MGSIAIKINPSKLDNSDADLRYLIPEKIEELTNKVVIDDGYDYLEDEQNSMVIFLQSDHPQNHVVKVLEILKNEDFLGNIIYDVAIVAIDEGNGYRVIHPDKYDEEFIV